MNNSILKNSFRFILLVIVQVLVLNNLNLFGFLNPMIYIIWVFLFPIRKSKSLFLILSFLLGLTIDFFSNSGGINAGATLFIAYIRLPILQAVLKKSDFDYLLFNLRAISFGKAFTFISILTFIHHFIIFSLEYFSFNSYSSIIYNTLLTSICTIIISILSIILFTNKK
ncbi:rod shape-determining protein MreD [Lutibacter citreus]|uniref:rod shape-determining protein MreD n=1 Tax=Lutibacter citreus TaxID=2138210 RepID=UPI000DBE7C07|nr:rod shape-determining protein MreD [Lutibacter citreus]